MQRQKIEKTIKKGYIFNETASAFESGKQIIIHKGGTGSGKTYEIMMFLIFYLALRKRNMVITVVSESRPHLDIGAIRIMKELLMKNELWQDYSFNKTSGTYTFLTGSIIEFFSADRIGKALGARRQVLYGNEINHIKLEVWDELARRSEYVIGDFNPTEQFWLEVFLVYYQNNIVIKSNYLKNYFLPLYEVERIRHRAEIDSNFRRVHIDCEYGHSEGLVIDNWEIVEDWPKEAGRVCWGIDWGFTNDPTAIIKVGLMDGDIYLDEVIYTTNLTNQDIINTIRHIINRYDNIWADSAEPKSIEEIRRAGYNIRPADKGSDSIKSGIDYIRRHRLKVTKKSVNLIKELRNYTWQTDKDGKPLNTPIDNWNHAIDSVRYAITMQYQRKPNKIISIS